MNPSAIPRDSVPLSCVQSAGDAIFVPDGWSHATIKVEKPRGGGRRSTRSGREVVGRVGTGFRPEGSRVFFHHGVRVVPEHVLRKMFGAFLDSTQGSIAFEHTSEGLCQFLAKLIWL